MKTINRAKRLNRGEFSRLIKVTRAISRLPERDILALALGHYCGMRVTETSRLTVADIMYADGSLRREISLRGAITKGCRQRCAYLSSKPLIAAIEAYIAYRIERGIGTELHPVRYRGLLPYEPLLYSSRGGALSQNTKRRTLSTGERRDYKACDALQSHITKLYQRAGLLGGSSHSGRRTFATKVLGATGEIKTVADLLGHGSIDCSQRYVDIDKRRLAEMFANAI